MTERVDATLIALRRVLRAIEGNTRSIARASGLTSAQMLVLHALAASGQELPSDIARRLGVSQATVTTQIDRLEARGLVRRERRQADRRTVWVILTDAGRQLLADTPDPLYGRFAARFAALPDWEQGMLMAGAERLAQLFDAQGVEPLPAGEEPARKPASPAA
ncbi:MAG: MarR family winged helix-turn-helix transcriptional regulator [Alkalilacustris sp.]